MWRLSGAGTCGGGPGSDDVDDLAIEPVLMQVARRRLDPPCGSYAAGFPRLGAGDLRAAFWLVDLLESAGYQGPARA
ncbi:hypothetical protein EAS64_08615 [Trebonia kvetii]|uniref:Uncharacterized protein n=1 Tax=Trebonia kvetii TaxID=2480626 RepID=A0A6P2CCN4_9ACTN|nr:hypothetical protein [Trebonia kvetii]TVZ07333.1 hypothetical protein EAS64_08615 [Trebonia kvetii]